MKYLEFFQRVQINFPDIADGMLISLFNQHSKMFQQYTYTGIKREVSIPFAQFTQGEYEYTPGIIVLESVSEGTNRFELLSIDTPNIIGKATTPNKAHLYFVFGDTIHLVSSDGEGKISPYTPTADVTITGKFVNEDNVLKTTSTASQEIDDALCVVVLNAIYADLYRLNPDTIKLAEYYDNQFKTLIREYRKFGLSAKRHGTVIHHEQISPIE